MEYKDGEPCGHPGCLSHLTHPCEKCGRIGGVTHPKLETTGGGMAKMETTVIKAGEKLKKPHMRPRNTDLENEIYRLKSELSRARQAVLEVVEKEVNDRVAVLETHVNDPRFDIDVCLGELAGSRYILSIIQRMKGEGK